MPHSPWIDRASVKIFPGLLVLANYAMLDNNTPNANPFD
jgi:hypothetical protein